MCGEIGKKELHNSNDIDNNDDENVSMSPWRELETSERVNELKRIPFNF
jgi:hypothetical protein